MNEIIKSMILLIFVAVSLLGIYNISYMDDEKKGFCGTERMDHTVLWWIGNVFFLLFYFRCVY